MTLALTQRLASWLERAVITLALLYLAVHTLPKAWKTLNTDFPQLLHVSAAGTWRFLIRRECMTGPWIEREKDHRAVDIRVIGLLPITPFSTLAVLPLAGRGPTGSQAYVDSGESSLADPTSMDAEVDDRA